MNITATAVAVTLAVVVAVAFLFLGPNVFRPFQSAEQTQQVPTDTMATTTDGLGAVPPIRGDGGGSASVPAQLPTTLTVKDEVTGTGAAVKAGDMITVNYVGMFPDGKVFDASASHAETKNGFAFTLGVDPVIKGWELGLVGMKVGGKRQLIIPPDMGYGSSDHGPIPGNSTLIFEVELLKIGQ